MLVSHLTSRLASGISKLVLNFRRRMIFLHYSCSHLGLVKQVGGKRKKRKQHSHLVCGPLRQLGGLAAGLASLHPGVPVQAGGTWALGRSSLGLPGGDPLGVRALT